MKLKLFKIGVYFTTNRLLHLADCELKGQEYDAEIMVENLPQMAVQSLEKLKMIYTHERPDYCKQEVFDLIITWKDELRVNKEWKI